MLSGPGFAVNHIYGIVDVRAKPSSWTITGSETMLRSCIESSAVGYRKVLVRRTSDIPAFHRLTVAES